ncbi:MAG: hypothetical protein Q8N23_13590 [Archangium sp.]|nr:hypothetical protein [Archangium sp.]MDP3569245.1 hypothetical protein [Archangium sp.]
MKRVVTALFLLTGAGCLSPVDDRWCGPQNPCSAGFFCTSDFHCVLSRDGGTGGGTMGGGTGGGGGRTDAGVDAGAGGGGGQRCDGMSCSSGCCLGGSCVPVNLQGQNTCGFFGDACKSCSRDEGCTSGRCQQVIFDAGVASSIGGPCADDSNCGNDGQSFCIPEFSGGQPTGFTGGYCSRTCDNEPCPMNGVCVEAETGGGDIVNICLAGCPNNICRAGYQCEMQGMSAVCLP